MVEYLKDENLFGRLLLTVGRLLFAFEIVVIVANFFLPVLYSFEGGVYRAGAARYITLAIQIVMFLMTTAYALAMEFSLFLGDRMVIPEAATPPWRSSCSNEASLSYCSSGVFHDRRSTSGPLVRLQGFTGGL